MKRLAFLIAAGFAGLLLYASWPHLTEDSASEMEMLAESLRIGPGATVADVGAGDGRMTLPAARLVGLQGTVYATEIEAEKRLELREAVSAETLDNVAIVEARPTRTNLPEACCDAIFLRRVYHHVSDPESFNEDIRRSLKPDGRVAIVDFTPSPRWFLPTPNGVPDSRDGHGVEPEAVVSEMAAAGLRLRERIDDWPGRAFCLIFEPAED